MRIGILGGTFDPIHFGHLLIAEEARAQMKLDTVIFVPNGIPSHKDSSAVSPAEIRLEMTERATESNPYFQVSRIEIDRPGKSYTFDTLSEFNEIYPTSELFFIIGMDSVPEITSWYRWQDIIQMASFVAAERPGFELENICKTIPAELSTKVKPLQTPLMEISATDIRLRVTEDKSIRYLLPDSVMRVIYNEQLYITS